MACGPSADNRSWTIIRTAPASHLTNFTQCPSGSPDPYGDMRHGIGVYDTLWGSQSPPGGELRPDGRFAETRFVAPPGTRLSAATLRRSLGRRFDRWTQYARVDGIDIPDETCDVGPYEVFCQRVGWTTLADLGAESLALGIRCVSSPGCPVGGSLHEAWALVLEAHVTLDDLTAPTVSSVEATGVASGGWQRGGGAVVFSASDNTGVQERRIVVGGVVRARELASGAAAGGCAGGTGDAFTYVDPCAGIRGVNGRRTVAVDPCLWGPGEHVLKAQAFDVDRAMTESAPVAVKVDCTAPIVSVASGATTREEGSVLTADIAVSDPTSGVASSSTEVSVDGGTWIAVANGLAVEAGRTYRFRARATDVAGNASAWAYSEVIAGVAKPVVVVTPPSVQPHPVSVPVPGESKILADAPAPLVQGPATAPARALEPLAPTATPTASTPTTGPRRLATKTRLRIARVRRHGRRITVSGTASRFATEVVVTLTIRGAKPRRRTIVVRSGSWRTTFALPRGAKSSGAIVAVRADETAVRLRLR